jgi:hypothetical protein
VLDGLDRGSAVDNPCLHAPSKAENRL